MDAGNAGRGRAAIVRLGLGDVVEIDQPGMRRVSYRRHATARPVVIERHGEAFLDPPEVGDRWEQLTVHARLHRMADVFRRLPHTPDTKPGGYRSCMPEPVREIFKNEPGEPMRLPVNAADHRAAMALLDVIVALTDDQRIVLWGLALRFSNREMAKHMRCDHKTVAKRKLDVLDILVLKLNTLGTRPDARDVERARELIHRNLK